MLQMVHARPKFCKATVSRIPPTAQYRLLRRKGIVPTRLQVYRVIGRTYERQVMEKFLISRLEARDKGALYISGLPGTGKSALLNQVTNEVIAKYSKTTRSGWQM